MSKPLLVRLGLVVASATVLMAQAAAPTDAERAACRSDAVSFCRGFVGKPQQMNACLRDNKTKLSDSCRKVVEARGG